MSNVITWLKSKLDKVAMVPRAAGSKTDNDPSQRDQEWPAVKPLQAKLRDVMPLQASMLPDTLFKFSTDQAYRFNNASPEFVVASTLVCAAALIGTRCKLAPKQFDKSWTVSQALWGLNIADPSKNKSGTMNVGVRLLKFAQRTVIDPNNSQRKKAATGGQDDDKSVNVPQRNVVVQDCTPEALLLHLQENPNGCLVSRDEIYGWLSKMERGEHAQERALYTEAFAGNNELVQKRVTRDPVVLEDYFVCIFGCIQPDRLRPLLKGRSNGESNDGFFERFQLITYDNNAASYTDHAADPNLMEKMRHIFCCLAVLDEHSIDLTSSFSTEAQQKWNTWARAQCEMSQLADTSDQSVMGKFPSLVAKLSLIFQLFSDAESTKDYLSFEPSNQVELCHLCMAIEFSDLLMSHNKRIQALLMGDTDLQLAEFLLKKLHKLPQQFDFRTLQRKKWSGLTELDDCQSALQILEKHGYVRSLNIRGRNGRDMVRYVVHPSIKNK